MKDEVVSQERLDQRNLNKKHAALRKCVLDSGKTPRGKQKENCLQGEFLFSCFFHLEYVDEFI